MISVCVAETHQLWQLLLASESRVLAKMQSISRYLTFFFKKRKTKRNKIVNAQGVGSWHWPFSVKRGQSLITVNAATLAEVGRHSYILSNGRAT